MEMIKKIACLPMAILGVAIMPMNLQAASSNISTNIKSEYTQLAYRGRAAVDRATPRVTATPRVDAVGPVVNTGPKAARVTNNTIYINNTTYNLYRPGAGVRLVAGSRCYVVNYGYGTVSNAACLYGGVYYKTFYIP